MGNANGGTMTYFKAKFVEDDGKEKWLSWSHWGNSVEEGFYYVSNEARAAIFAEESLQEEEVIKALGAKHFIVYEVDEIQAKKYRSRVYR